VLFMEEQKNEVAVRNPKGGVVLGSLSEKGFNIPDDFNDPLEDFNDYM